MYKITCLALLVLVLNGCSGQTAITGQADADPIRSGDALELTRPLTVPAGSASVYIQNGTAVPAGNHDPYYAWCRLVMNTFLPTSRTITATTFRITAIRKEVNDVGLRLPQYAALGISLANGPTADEYSTTFYLHSDEEPDVDRLVCAHWEDPTIFPRHLTARQIRDTLSPLMVFK